MSTWIQLPQHFNFDDLVNEARVGRFNPEAFVQSVALDLSQTQFVGIGAAACLKALALRYQDGWPEGECLAMRHGGQDCISYLRRMDFFVDDIRWCVPEEEARLCRHDETGGFVPLQKPLTDHDSAIVAKRAIECFQGLDARIAATLKYAVSEIIDNALQHAGFAHGAVVGAQAYPNMADRPIDVVVADCGIGIRQHLTQHPLYRSLTDDAEALRIALTPNVTGVYRHRAAGERPDPQASENQGIGLSVVNSLARRNAGRLVVWSGRAIYDSRQGIAPMPVAWPGTAVFLRLPTRLQVFHREIVDEIHVPRATGVKRLGFE
jgi:anti-sigma regulatory factor (Ser/Thr protein kinase)